MQFLADELERVERRLAPVGEEKATALARTREPDFWDGDGQTPTLARIEYLDRVEAALGTAGRLLSRLHQERESACPPNAEVVLVLAERLYLLDRVADELDCGDPPDAYLWLTLARSPRPCRRCPRLRGPAASCTSAGQSAAAWNTDDPARGPRRAPPGDFRVRRLHDPQGRSRPPRPRGAPRDQGFARANVHVAVAPRTDASRTVEELEEDAGRALSGSPAPQTVVRRYRREPSPLVRDASGWRTGRIDQVLAGDFDLRPAQAGE